MSDPGPGNTDDARESFVERWSRLKKQAREHTAPDSPAPLPPAADADASDAPVAAPVTEPAIELPDLAQLDQDSDYSAFLTPGVDAALRRRALRQLFSSPKFNVFDGLDTYRDDFRNFAPLGDIVTADMRHHVERLAREAARLLDAQGASEVPPASAATVAATPTAPRETQDPSPDPIPSSDMEEDLDHRPD